MAAYNMYGEALEMRHFCIQKTGYSNTFVVKSLYLESLLDGKQTEQMGLRLWGRQAFDGCSQYGGGLGMRNPKHKVDIKNKILGTAF